MKKSRFSDSSILAVLKQADGGTTMVSLLQEHGISNATFYKWRAKDECGVVDEFHAPSIVRWSPLSFIQRIR